jgi:hypothetical protein
MVYYKNVVSFSIKLAAVQASGGARMKLHHASMASLMRLRLI